MGGQSGTSAVGGPVLAHSDVLLRPGQSASQPFLGGSPQTRPAGSGYDLASLSRFMEIIGVR